MTTPTTQTSTALLRFATGDLAGAVATIFDCQFMDPDGETDAHGMVATVRELVTIVAAAGYPRDAERIRNAAFGAFSRAGKIGARLGEGAVDAGRGEDSADPGASAASGAPKEAGDASGMEWLMPEDFRERDFILDPGSTLGIQLEQARSWIENAGRYTVLDLDCPTGILLAGPTGTGKTVAAHWLAAKTGRPCAIARHDALASRFIGQNLKNLRAMIAAAVARGALLFFDEVDAIARDRRLAGQNESHRIEMLESFLEQLSILRKRHPEFVIVSATNLPDVLDDAFVRRVAVTIEFDFLGESARTELLRALYTRVDCDADAEELLLLRSAGKSGDYLRSVAMTAARGAVAALGADDLAILDAHRAAAKPAEDGAPAPPLPALPRPRVTREHVGAALAVVRDQATSRRTKRKPVEPLIIQGR